MSPKYIPEYIDPFRHAEQNLAMDGLVKIAEMERLSTNLVGNDNVVSVHMQFGVDEQGINFLKGHLETKLVLQCQRCMEPYTYEIMADFLLGVISTLDEAEGLPERYEPALAKDGQLALRELIEDELILTLPIIPKHEPEQCSVKLPLATETGWQHEEKKNPFHVLKTLKDKQQ